MEKLLWPTALWVRCARHTHHSLCAPNTVAHGGPEVGGGGQRVPDARDRVPPLTQAKDSSLLRNCLTSPSLPFDCSGNSDDCRLPAQGLDSFFASVRDCVWCPATLGEPPYRIPAHSVLAAWERRDRPRQPHLQRQPLPLA